MTNGISGRFTRIGNTRIIEAVMKYFRPSQGIARFRLGPSKSDIKDVRNAINDLRAKNEGHIGLGRILGTQLKDHVVVGVPFEDDTTIATIGPITEFDGRPVPLPVDDLENTLGAKALPEPLESQVEFDLSELPAADLNLNERVTRPAQIAVRILTAIEAFFPNPRFTPIHFRNTQEIDRGKLWRGAMFGAAFFDPENPSAAMMVLFRGNLRKPWGEDSMYFIGGGSTEWDASIHRAHLSIHLTNPQDNMTLDGHEVLSADARGFAAALCDSPLMLRPASERLILTVPRNVEPDPTFFAKLNMTEKGAIVSFS